MEIGLEDLDEAVEKRALELAMEVLPLDAWSSARCPEWSNLFGNFGM